MKKELIKSTQDLFFPGLDRALDSVRKIFDVEARLDKVGVSDHKEIKIIIPESDSLYLKTEIIGDHDGVSFLIFDKSKVEHLLLNHCTSLGIVDPLNFLDFLKEIDNILSANVVSHLADSLDISIFGDAPTYADYSLLEHHVNSLVESSEELTNPTLFVSTKFMIHAPFKMNIDFIWFVKKSFVDLADSKREYETKN